MEDLWQGIPVSETLGFALPGLTRPRLTAPGWRVGRVVQDAFAPEPRAALRVFTTVKACLLQTGAKASVKIVFFFFWISLCFFPCGENQID